MPLLYGLQEVRGSVLLLSPLRCHGDLEASVGLCPGAHTWSSVSPVSPKLPTKSSPIPSWYPMLLALHSHTLHWYHAFLSCSNWEVDCMPSSLTCLELLNGKNSVNRL